MPVYEFSCNYCLYRFEVRQTSYDNVDTRCPKCKRVAKRVFTPTSAIFQGSGWSTTENRGERQVEPKESIIERATRDVSAAKERIGNERASLKSRKKSSR